MSALLIMVSIFLIMIVGLRYGTISENVSASADVSIDFRCACCGAIRPGEALFPVLVSRGIPANIAENVRKSLSSVLDMRKIKPGDKYLIEYLPDGKLHKFELCRSPWEKYSVIGYGDKLIATKDTIELTSTVVAINGIVQNTLWESMIGAGVEAEAILDFTDALAYDFDFVTDTRNGHKFLIVYERISFGDSIIGIGKVLLAQYETQKKQYTAIWYTDPSGRKGYFDFAGNSMRKSLLKTPLNYRRISSHFSYARYHPILKIYRPHLGVDYAAPEGTPVVASGSGKVTFAGIKGGYGKYIEIDHRNGIVTTYGHLSRFAKGIRTGANVERGQLIGYVGSTGLATGPHLDYRVKVKGNFVNPEKYVFPSEPPVDRKYMGDYVKYAKSVYDLSRIMSSVSLAKAKFADTEK